MVALRRGPQEEDAAGTCDEQPVAKADVVGACGLIARSLGAQHFAVFSLVGAGGRGRLVPIFDSTHPDIGDISRVLSSANGEALRRHVMRSANPCRWSEAEEKAASGLATTIPALPECPDGIAFPVFAEGGRGGAFAFIGPRLAAGDAELCDTHLRCMLLFQDIAQLRAAEAARKPKISRRELECLRLTARGLTSDEIATRLGLSVHTANQYLANTAQKLDAVNRMHAVAKAMRLGLID
jgi:DNA-binding CsgD family transcriptional regulator